MMTKKNKTMKTVVYMHMQMCGRARTSCWRRRSYYYYYIIITIIIIIIIISRERGPAVGEEVGEPVGEHVGEQLDGEDGREGRVERVQQLPLSQQTNYILLYYIII